MAKQQQSLCRTGNTRRGDRACRVRRVILYRQLRRFYRSVPTAYNDVCRSFRSIISMVRKRNIASVCRSQPNIRSHNRVARRTSFLRSRRSSTAHPGEYASGLNTVSNAVPAISPNARRAVLFASCVLFSVFN